VRIALPLHGDDIAPRFCAANRVLIVDVVDGEVAARQVLSLHGDGIPDRVEQLVDLGVVRLLCGGFGRRYLPLAEAHGLQVSWGLWGPAEVRLRAFLAGEELPSIDCPGRGRRRGRGRGRRNGRRRWRRPGNHLEDR